MSVRLVTYEPNPRAWKATITYISHFGLPPHFPVPLFCGSARLARLDIDVKAWPQGEGRQWIWDAEPKPIGGDTVPVS